jgi:hypothetical protein
MTLSEISFASVQNAMASSYTRGGSQNSLTLHMAAGLQLELIAQTSGANFTTAAFSPAAQAAALRETPANGALDASVESAPALDPGYRGTVISVRG